MALPLLCKPSRLISPSRARQLHRALKNLKLSLICGLLTVLVLRGALGAGKYGTPATDFEEIKHQFERVHSLRIITRKQASRVLAEVIEEKQRPLKAHVQSAASYNYLSEKQSNDGGLQGTYAFKEGNLDVKFTVDLTEPSSLSEKADVQVRARLGTNPKVMLVTGYHSSVCKNPVGDHFLLKLAKNKADYCKLHNMEILYDSAFVEAEVSGLTAKLSILRKLMLSHPEVEWFWWIASDALFTDMAFQLPIEKYENYSVVLHGWDNMQKTSRGAFTAGSFLIRNRQESLNLLDTWVKSSLTGLPKPHDDQSASPRLLTNEKRNLAEQEVLLDKSILFHRYSKTPASHTEDEMKKNYDIEDSNENSRPSVMHFVRHKLCEKGVNAGDDNSAIFFKDIERALHMADSQVLQLQQKSSSSKAMRLLRGGHRRSKSEDVSSMPHQSML